MQEYVKKQNETIKNAEEVMFRYRANKKGNLVSRQVEFIEGENIVMIDEKHEIVQFQKMNKKQLKQRKKNGEVIENWRDYE